MELYSRRLPAASHHFTLRQHARRHHRHLQGCERVEEKIRHRGKVNWPLQALQNQLKPGLDQHDGGGDGGAVDDDERERQ